MGKNAAQFDPVWPSVTQCDPVWPSLTQCDPFLRTEGSIKLELSDEIQCKNENEKSEYVFAIFSLMSWHNEILWNIHGLIPVHIIISMTQINLDILPKGRFNIKYVSPEYVSNLASSFSKAKWTCIHTYMGHSTRLGHDLWRWKLLHP